MRPVLAPSWLPIALVPLVLGGCSHPRDDLPREAVSGKVSFEGEPIARGAILFKPSGGSAQAIEAGGLIRDGEYRIDDDEGPVPGTYRVMITEEVDRPKGDGNNFAIRPGEGASRISSRYNAKTTLTAEVKPGQPNQFDFDLKKSDERESRPTGRPARRR
jgi:hypothetical protein